MNETEVDSGSAPKGSVEKEESSQDIETQNEELEASAEDNVEELKSEKEEPDYKEKFYYLAAEMENMKRRFEREKESLVKYGNEKVLSGLLEVVDNLDLSIKAIENDEDEKVKNLYIGIDMVKKKFIDVLKNNGLEEVEAVGKIFDPNFHEAMAQRPAEGEEDQTVLEEFQKGYVLNGRLLRAAKVVIAKN